MNLIEQMIAHAAETPDLEVCGLVASDGTAWRLIRAENVHHKPDEAFTISEQAWLDVEDSEDVIAVYHSHPRTSPEPSMADRSMCEATGLQWHIVTPDGRHQSLSPVGYAAPYEGRYYVYMVHDCFTLVRDFYEREFAIDVPDMERPFEFWLGDTDLLDQGFSERGFVRVDGQEPHRGDIFMVKVAARVTNHLAIYLEGGKILHHAAGRISRVEDFGEQWRSRVTHHLRHIDRMG